LAHCGHDSFLDGIEMLPANVSLARPNVCIDLRFDSTPRMLAKLARQRIF